MTATTNNVMTQAEADALVAANQRLERRVGALEEALEMVILYHSGGWWDENKSRRWERWTGRPEATTRALCDQLRTLRASTEGSGGE